MTTHPVLPSGQQWTIRHGAWEATITQVGGGLRVLRHAGRDVVVGHAEDRRTSDGRGQTLAPWPNRVGDGRFTWNGEEHQLPLTEVERATALHGLVAWLRWEVVDHAPDRILVGVTVHPRPGWEWTFRLEVDHTLTEAGLTVTPQVTNLSGDTMPFAYGAHPYLTAGESVVDDLELTLPAAARLEVDPDRRLPHADATPSPIPADLDFGRPRLVGATALDDAFTALQADADGRWRVRLGHGDGETVLWGEADDLGWVQVFTGDALPEGEARRTGLAVEPMTAPPDALRSGTDLLALAPGEAWTTRWGITAT